MSNQNSDSMNQQPDTGHDYDGIREYDNPVPAWWSWLFILTIAFSVVYVFFVTLAGGDLSPAGFFKRSEVAQQMRLMKDLGELKADEPTLLRLAADGKWLPVGQSIFLTNCVSCHGKNGEGLSAPNLTDEAYIYVSAVTDINDVVTKGRKNGAMPAWNNRLSPNEIILVSSYIASLHGQNLTGPRGSEGTLKPKWTVGVKP